VLLDPARDHRFARRLPLISRAGFCCGRERLRARHIPTARQIVFAAQLADEPAAG
jgi:hypothetical protein